MVHQQRPQLLLQSLPQFRIPPTPVQPVVQRRGESRRARYPPDVPLATEQPALDFGTLESGDDLQVVGGCMEDGVLGRVVDGNAGDGDGQGNGQHDS
jgi:hypothetical protein